MRMLLFSLIEYYQPDIAPHFWKNLKTLILTGQVKLIDSVYEEIVSKAKTEDWLVKWMKSLKNSVVKASQDYKVINTFEKIAQFVNKTYTSPHKNIFLNGADPWLIAYAKVYNYTIVSMEVFKNEEIDPKTGLIKGKVKLPNVAQHFKVKVIKVYEAVKILKIQLG